tara:strand:- start:2221 stop:2922 length:702 start_codon:yes stop_codon:yes gene_type:complete
MVEKYFEEDSVSPYQSKYKLKLFVFIVFVGIILLLIYTSFVGNFSFIGGTIIENISINKIKINADLTIPQLELDDEFNSIKIEGNSNSFLYVGDQKFSLADLNKNYIILDNYDGEIYFDNENIFKFKGKVNNTIINSIPVTSKSGKNTKIYFDENFNYDSLEIKDRAFIRKLDYVTSGKISLNNGKNVFDISNEKLIINNFQGDLKINRKKLNLDGYITGLKIVGDSDISIMS